MTLPLIFAIELVAPSIKYQYIISLVIVCTQAGIPVKLDGYLMFTVQYLHKDSDMHALCLIS